MPTGIQDTSNANPVPVANALGLVDGMNPLVIPLNVNLTVNSSVLVDMTQQQQRGQIGPIQTIYIDNSDNAQEVSIVTQILGQEITIPAGDSAILPIFLATTAPKFTVNTTGGVILPIFLMNFPLPAAVWGATFGGATFQTVNGHSSINVVDTVLQALISNIGGAGNALDVNVLSGGGGGGGGAVSNLIASVITSGGSGVLIGGNSGAGKFWHVTDLDISISNDASDGVGGSHTLQIFEGGAPFTVFAACQVYVPLATPTAPLAGAQRILSISDANGLFTNDNANSLFNMNSSVLTTGKFSVNMYGYAL